MRDLDIEVAKALGWRLIPLGGKSPLQEFCREGGTEQWVSPSGEGYCTRCEAAPPRFSTDWNEAGPLMERFKIAVISDSAEADPDEFGWYAEVRRDQFADLPSLESVDGKTPCEAIARLIVELAKQGKLPK